MLSRFYNHLRLCGVVGGVLLSNPLLAQNSTLQVVQGYTGLNPQQAKPIGTLQVTGTNSRFTISANRAEVTDALKLLFDQAEKQFVLEGNITGTVTLRLNEQPLGVVLPAICRQAFLRYRFDPVSGIFHIERDEASVRAAFQQLRNLDAELRNQLRLMGLSLPNDTIIINPAARVFNSQPQSSGLRGAGAFGGNLAITPKANGDTAAETNINAQRYKVKGNGEENAKDKPSNGLLLDMSYNEDYQQFLKQNNFVYFSIPKDKPEPIFSVLQLWSKQANVPILVDPSVPRGSKFVIRGSIPPRPIMDALNSLAPYARLEWKWVGNSIFVTTTPDFEMLLNEVSIAKTNSSQQRGEYRKIDRRGAEGDKKGEEPPKEKPSPPKQ
jgi:hypothetical protein